MATWRVCRPAQHASGITWPPAFDSRLRRGGPRRGSCPPGPLGSRPGRPRRFPFPAARRRGGPQPL